MVLPVLWNRDKCLKFKKKHIWYYINKVISLHKRKPGSRMNSLKNKIYAKIKNCPHCDKPYLRKNKKGEDYKTAWILCPLCGYVFCVSCFSWVDGCGRCPRCY